MNSLRVDAPNTSFSGDDLLGLNWGSVTSQLSNSSIAFQTLSADALSLRTSNSSISGSFDAGQIELQTSNSSISAKLRVKEDVHGRQSVVSTKTSNSSITLHVNAAEATHGLWMDTITKNGKINVGTLLGQSNTQSSFINLRTENSRIELNLDASQTGQPLEVNTKTSNSTIVSSIMVPRGEVFKGVVETSNSSANLNLVSINIACLLENNIMMVSNIMLFTPRTHRRRISKDNSKCQRAILLPQLKDLDSALTRIRRAIRPVLEAWDRAMSGSLPAILLPTCDSTQLGTVWHRATIKKKS